MGQDQRGKRPVSDIDLAYAIGLKPEKAIEYFKAKGFAFSWDWQEIWQEAHARAFTVAKVTRLDILQDIRDGLQEALDNGITYQEFAKAIKPSLKAKGWWGEVVNEATGEIAVVGPHRLRTIFDTNVQTAYDVGQYRTQTEMTETHPWWQYSAVNDSRTRPSHSALNGLVFRHDDPFWDTHRPRNGFRCRCSVRVLKESQLQELEQDGRAARRSTVGANATATMEEIEKPLGRGKGMTNVTTVKTTGLNGERVAVAPDVGWNYNPGKTDWKPEPNRWSPEIARLAK
jgi:SPP1 gp7 family putative phage head morphogenesis protein